MVKDNFEELRNMTDAEREALTEKVLNSPCVRRKAEQAREMLKKCPPDIEKWRSELSSKS